MPVNHVKEFLKSDHNEALFSGLVFRTLIEVSSLNFKAKFLKMAKINSEFLNVSLVEPAPESATTLVSLLHIFQDFYKVFLTIQKMNINNERILNIETTTFVFYRKPKKPIYHYMHIPSPFKRGVPN